MSLTSQMGCNRLINPMFVGFYAFYYGLFSLRVISSGDLSAPGEVLGVQSVTLAGWYFSCQGLDRDLSACSLRWATLPTSEGEPWEPQPTHLPCCCGF